MLQHKLHCRNLLFHLFVSALLGLVVLAPPSTMAAQNTVRFPITLDYPLLKSLVVSTAFHGDGETAVLINENGGCTRLVLSNPSFSNENGLIRFQIHISIQGGTFIGGNCLLPVQWEGYLVLLQSPVINADTWTLSFRTEGSSLYESDGRPAEIAEILWDLIKSWVYEYLNSIHVDLAPPVGDLKAFLLPLFNDADRIQTKRIVESLRYGSIEVTPSAVVIDLLGDFPSTVSSPSPSMGSPSGQSETPLSPRELSQFTQLWESWDVLLVEMLTQLSKKPVTAQERQVLLDVLLGTRYRFSDELTKPHPERDFVRIQFLDAWKRLSPIFRSHLTAASDRTTLGYLSFFTASDALEALDKLSPALGIEISRDGLIRMARWLAGSNEAPLEYLPDVNQELRRLVGFELQPDPLPRDDEPTEISPPPAEMPAPLEKPQDPPIPGVGILKFLIPRVWAAETPLSAKIDPNILKWVVPDTGLDEYVDRVRSVVDRSAQPVISKIPDAHIDAFKRIMPAMAWQESCFRQFISDQGKINYLRSYNGSSVGLMQINERVWRGVFDLSRLRWDIAYNAQAGCQIAALYINKYAIPNWKSKRPMEDGVLAQVVYAMYNGGPGQFERFFDRLKTGKLLYSDTLFFEKLQWVENGKWDNINQCLQGQ
jgi:hypothetical protein